ncbi:UDP-N-acetylmuramoyl-tripeptide--D-alanyl-D-alanine ligase [Ideonella sp.]|uniref:UDP-N-acetylmuramoyl-tripeptide--D-alanyl-D- alanine ligase n=1 Tax=Ideonella sp. TaxID=1929293 RepID=UPI003BB4F3C2
MSLQPSTAFGTDLDLDLAAGLLPAAVRVGEGSPVLKRVHTDSRSLQPGDLFVALQGERFDAHDFLPQALAAGAVAVLGSRDVATAGLPGLQVADSLQALQQLATGWRARQSLPLIAVTGSNGKTTTTQMIASILRAAHGEQALATAGNLNNHIGVPLTVLRLRGHAAAVVELGMNHPGEIAELAAIAQPTVALVNNAQREHLEFMHTVEAVARENGSVISALPADGLAVFPADDAWTPLWRELAGGRQVLTFSATGAADVMADVTAEAQWQAGAWRLSLQTPAGPAVVQLHIAGRHNVANALAATACALAAGVPLAAVVQGLNAFAPVKGRSQVHRLPAAGAAERSLIDDTYNANPDSVQAAIAVLAELPGPRWLLLGDMGEVGDQGPMFHAEAGAQAAASGIEHFWCAGQASAHAAQAYGAGARHFADTAALLAEVSVVATRPAFASVLVKGSRFMKMEQIVAALQAAHNDKEQACS